MDIRVVELKPMRVACFQFVGENPELRAWNTLIEWAKRKNLVGKGKKRQFFGFNNPPPSKDRPTYGYEVWMTVEEGVKGNEVVKVKEFKGSLYAVTRTTLSDCGKTWNSFHPYMPWMKENKYEYDNGNQWLEEHLDIDKLGKPNMRLDLYLPIKPTRRQMNT